MPNTKKETMNWENAKAFGLVKVNPSANTIHLFYDRNNSFNISSPNAFMTMESAIWQGNNLIVRGRNQYDEPTAYLYESEYNYQMIL